MTLDQAFEKFRQAFPQIPPDDVHFKASFMYGFYSGMEFLGDAAKTPFGAGRVKKAIDECEAFISDFEESHSLAIDAGKLNG